MADGQPPKHRGEGSSFHSANGHVLAVLGRMCRPQPCRSVLTPRDTVKAQVLWTSHFVPARDASHISREHLVDQDTHQETVPFRVYGFLSCELL